MKRTNFLADIRESDLPLDNRRSPGYRRIEPHMAGQRFYLWIGQHENGRYSKAHRHGSSAILICAKGKGYTYTWPEQLGMTPWKDGHGGKVLRQDYEEGGMVSAAPMSGDWYHQHFGTGSGPLRLTAWFGPNNHDGMKPGVPGEQLGDIWAWDIDKGGKAIPYRLEDPFIRAEYEAELANYGAKSRMEDQLYNPNS